MVEFGILEFKALHEFPNDKIAAGTKPCLLFSGPIFEHDPEMIRVKSLMIDFFRGPVVTHIRLAGLEHAIQVRREIHNPAINDLNKMFKTSCF
jgi:ribosome production factor 2